MLVVLFVNQLFVIHDVYVIVKMYRTIKINVFAIFELVFQYARDESYWFSEKVKELGKELL